MCIYISQNVEEVARTLLRCGGCGLSALPNIPAPPPTYRPRPRRFANGILIRQRTLSSEPCDRNPDAEAREDLLIRLKPEFRASRRNSGIRSLTGRYEKSAESTLFKIVL